MTKNAPRPTGFDLVLSIRVFPTYEAGSGREITPEKEFHATFANWQGALPAEGSFVSFSASNRYADDVATIGEQRWSFGTDGTVCTILINIEADPPACRRAIGIFEQLGYEGD